MTFTKRINMQTVGAAELLAVALSVPAMAAEKPSFDCGKVQAGSIEELVCQDAGLTKLDQQLAEVYAQAADKAKNEQPPMLKAMQRGWVKGRDACWQAVDRHRASLDVLMLKTVPAACLPLHMLTSYAGYLLQREQQTAEDVAMMVSHFYDFLPLLSRADDALYQAKRAGRDRVRTHGLESDTTEIAAT